MEVWKRKFSVAPVAAGIGLIETCGQEKGVVDFIQKDYFQVKITQISQNDFLQSYHLFSPGDLKIFIFYRNISSLCTARVS